MYGRENILTVWIDSLNSYQAAMPEEQFLTCCSASTGTVPRRF
jgi:hypothetical protein